MRTFPGISEKYLRTHISLGEVFDLLELADESLTGHIRESDYHGSISGHGKEVTADEMGDKPPL